MTCRYQPHSPAITLGHRGKVVRIVLDNTPSRRICAPTPPHPPVGARFIGDTAAGAGARRIGNNTAHRAESALLHLLIHPEEPELSATPRQAQGAGGLATAPPIAQNLRSYTASSTRRGALPRCDRDRR